MSAFYDARCKCGRRIGWHGKVSDRPACPNCGYRLSDAELRESEQELEALKELLRTRPSAHVCYNQRVAAGLSLREAAARLSILPRELSDVEHGRAPMPDSLAEKMSEVYDMGPDQGNE